MTDADDPAWYPSVDESVSPEDQQQAIIQDDAYPMRVLAGAGTGKTFTMVRKIERLIDADDVPSGRILALTFTNKAADSMREKLNAKLGADGYDIDAYTYHSICHRLLQEYAYHAGLDPDFEIATDADKYALVLDSLDDIPYRFVKPDVHDPDSWGKGIVQRLLGFVAAMKRSGIQPADLDAYLGQADRLATLQELPADIEALADEHLRGLSVTEEADLDVAEQALSTMASALADHRDQLDPDAAGIEQTVATYLDLLVDACHSLYAEFESHIDAIENGDLEYANKLPAYLFGSYSGPPKGIPKVGFTFPNKLDSYLSACAKARDLTEGYAAYEQQLTANDLLDFDDLVLQTLALLTDDSLGAVIADQWDYVFCDEFQDTDPLQFELVRALATDDRLFVVGDDDQAIYEWRGANIENITTELDDAYGEALVDRRLEENFRSHQPILDLANGTLSRLDARQREKELTRIDGPDYDGTAVATISALDEDGEKREEEARAAQLTRTITHLLAGEHDDVQRAYDPGEIAILVRKNRHAKPLIDAFREAGVPYQLAGDLAADSVGVETVLAYLKVLANPIADEVSLNRVLTMRYRVHDTDLRTLNRGDESLLTALRETPAADLVEPDPVQEAADHINHLLELRDSCSLARLYRELKEVTDIEWYLSEQDRRDLAALEDLINSFGEGTIQPELNDEFIELLSYHGSLIEESTGSPVEQPDESTGAVNIMTIHKSKGLDFPVVMVPELFADQWAPSERGYARLNHAISAGPTEGFARNFKQRDARESRRVLHVALTRAEEHLILQGGAVDVGATAADHELPFDFVTSALPDAVPWTPGGLTIPVWEDLQDHLPKEHADWTDSLAASWSSAAAGELQYEGEQLTVGEARETVLGFAEALFDGRLAADTEAAPVSLAQLQGRADPTISYRHSYTSLETFTTCPRKHYLDHVVYSIETVGSNGESSGVSQRAIGVLFHETAERAFNRSLDTPSEWKELCEQVAQEHGFEAAVSAGHECIDRYFELDVSDWTKESAERDFLITIGEATVTGQIDGIYRRPDGELVVVDYKATEQSRDIGQKRQLPLYLLACREIFDEPVSVAGYAFVGDLGPAVEFKRFSDEELESVRDDLAGLLETVEGTGFGEYQTGKHCQWCPHRDLPCSDDAPLSE